MRSSFRARDMSRWGSRRPEKFSGRFPAFWRTSNSRKFLLLDQSVARSAQVVLDTASSEFEVYARADASDNSWDVACTRMRQASQSTGTGQQSISPKFDGVVPNRSIAEECNRRFADIRIQLRPDVPRNRADYGGANARFSPRSTSQSSLSDTSFRLSIASGHLLTPVFKLLAALPTCGQAGRA